MGNSNSTETQTQSQPMDAMNMKTQTALIDNEEEERVIASGLEGEDAWYLASSDHDSDYVYDTSDDEHEDEHEDDYDEQDNDDNEDEDEELVDRLQILEDAKQLKKLAVAFLHPETPLYISPLQMARCYFDRCSCSYEGYSAFVHESCNEAEYRHLVLEDAWRLKQLAIDYAHPELGVSISDVDPCACAKCYFSNGWTTPQESLEESQERAAILQDVVQLRMAARQYLHPEDSIKITSTVTSTVTSTSTVIPATRCYFDRYSAPQQESVEDAEYRNMVLNDARALTLKIEYICAPAPVSTSASSDAFAFGRGYFDRYSAILQESFEDAEERNRILEDVMDLKKLAVDYFHPEIGVASTDPSAFGRCYFTRSSAVEQESFEEAEERNRILDDVMGLKKLAVDYMHPEMRVTTTDSFAFGRCYFSQPLAVEQESFEEAEERNMILEDAMELKQVAVDYLHPEISVVSMDPFAFGRCYFTRSSAVEQESFEDAEEHNRILEDALKLKKLAVDYMHPEMRVTTTDPFAFGRCYFSQSLAVEQESFEEAEERNMILEDAMELKQLAVDYLHPEISVVSMDPFAFGRCYFTRSSAVEKESVEDAEERNMILTDAMELKKLAVDYMHPEISVVSMDPFVFGRCYFTRSSAVEQESFKDSEERGMILDDALKLKQLAVDYMHPEVGMTSSNPIAFGRCYYDRYSATIPESPEDAKDHVLILNDAANLKRLAMDYMHPEVGVVTSDLAACARCYFDRISAIHRESVEEAEEHHKVLVDAMNLKILANQFSSKVNNFTLKGIDSDFSDDDNDVRVSHSASAVHLYGLDDDCANAAYF